MGLKLPESIASAQDISAVIVEIRQYGQWYLHEAIKQRVSGKKSAKESPTLSKAANEILKSVDDKKGLSRQSLDQIIKTLEDYAKKAPTVQVTLAAPVTSSVKETIVSWCRDNIAENVLVTFQHNSTILGGLVVRFKSRVFDWSFRRQLLDKASAFPEVLRRV